MTGLYVRSNVQSLVSQHQINRNLNELSTIMTRLSTGLRINSGKDDPAGLIASELLKADMTATSKAVTNTQRANSMVAIADAALGQISSLLNDIKGLVVESANTGTMTYEQIRANQLQIDASLDSIDRIAKMTNYLGKPLLDGSMDFQTTGLNRTDVTNLQVHEANFGTNTKVDVGINVIQDAGTAQLFYNKAGISQDTVLEIIGFEGSNLVNISAGSTVEDIAAAINLSSDSTGVRAIVGTDSTAGQIFITSAGLDNDLNLTALLTGAAAGNYTVKFTAGDTDKTTYTITEPQNGKPGIIDFKLKMQPNASPFADKFDESYNGIYTYDISGTRTINGFEDVDIIVQSTNGDQIRHIEFVQSAGLNSSIPGGVAASFNKATGKLQIQYDASGNVTEEALRRAINAIDGLEYLGTYLNNAGGVAGETTKFASINYVQIGSTDMYLHHTNPSANLLNINFEASGDSTSTVSVAYTDDTNITVTYGSEASYEEVLAALNTPSNWNMTVTPPLTAAVIRPATNSFKLLDKYGDPAQGTKESAAAIGGVSGTPTTVTLGYSVDPAGKQVGLTSLGGDVYLRATNEEWNGLGLDIVINTTAGDTTQSVDFDGDTITVTIGDALKDVISYNDILALLKDTASWTINGGYTGPLPDPNGLALTNSNGGPITGVTDSGRKVTLAQLGGAGSDVYLRTTGDSWDGVGFAIATGGAPASGIVAVFDGGTNTVTVTVGSDIAASTSYADLLTAIKDSNNWTLTGGATLPSLSGLSITDYRGSTTTTALNFIATTNTHFATITETPVYAPVRDINTTLHIVGVSDATLALREYLSVNGLKGTKAAVDIRANNAINITAAVPGTKFEDSDIVYVKAQGDVFTESFRLGYQNVYASLQYNPASITAPDDLKEYTIKFITSSALGAQAAVDTTNKILTVDVGVGATIADVLREIRNITGGAWANFDFLDATQAPIDQNQSASSLAGKSLTLGKVQLDYRDTPTTAAATITLDDGAVKLRIAAATVGTQYNDVMIEFEQDNSFKPGDVSVAYDEVRKILHIRGQIDGVDAATYGSLKSAIESVSPFIVSITTTSDNKAVALSTKIHNGLSTAAPGTSGLTENKPGNSAVIKTGQYVGDLGGNHQTLYITVTEEATANDVVEAFRNAKGSSAQIAANFIVSNAIDNDGTGTIFNKIVDRKLNVRVFAEALKGGNSGLETAVTAKELVEFINNDAILSKLFLADVARGQIGNGYLTLFDEAAYYGSTINDNALQFLGPKGSPDVLFVIDGAGSELGLSFIDNYGSGCIGDDRPVASLNSSNPNAAFEVKALVGGSQYTDMIVRMIRLDNNHAVEDSYAQYKDGPSNSMAYCSINNDQTLDGTTKEKGKFVIYAKQQGDRYNNVEVVTRLDINQSEAAKAYFDEATKKLIITVNSGDTTLSDAIAAINNEGTFQAEYDYSFNTDPTDGLSSDGPGLETFAKLLSAVGTSETVIGNTGTTGGHKGGVLEVYIGGKTEEVTANTIIHTINSSPTLQHIFSATPIGGGEAGTGAIHFRYDNIRPVIGSDGITRNEANMVTGILGSDENAPSYMVVHLATDKNGFVTTTANDLVKFFDQLTAEQTRGISVSVVRPPGVDNLDRVWTVGPCGELIESQLCESLYGTGLLQPTYTINDCGDITYYPIEFFSYGEELRGGNPHGSVIAQNGKDASLEIRAKVLGPDFNGVNFKYVQLGDPTASMYAEYDGYSKMITVYIHEGTTAGLVKQVIESSEQTKNLFEVSLPGNGSGVVSVQDDYLLLKGGIYDVGYRGGAAMLGAADADAHRLIIESIGEGSRQFVRVLLLNGQSGAEFNVTDFYGNTTDTAHGTDMIATINGMKASADGRSLTLSSAMLKMDVILNDYITTGDQIYFTITGGGALIQMGPEVVSNQQVRFALPSVSTAHLGGGSGLLYQLRTGQAADLLTSDQSRRLADRIVSEAIMSVARTRGRIGSIQRNTLEPQINALQDSLVAISSAEAQISNADFAEESSRLTRSQILVQAGTRTLSIANQFPQYAASLLGG